MSNRNIILEESWKLKLLKEFEKAYFENIREKLVKDKKDGVSIFPPNQQIFAALNNTPWDQVRVVIIGQDPYHGYGQANGLCFSVNPGIKLPPSLINIYKEIEQDLGQKMDFGDGDLTRWAKQGVLLLNSVLTVQANSPASHAQIGWQFFTDTIISKLANEKDHLVFVLWGKYAQAKQNLIPEGKHLIICSAHPSPFSAHQGFFGSRPFSRANEYLQQHGQQEILWANKKPDF